MFPAPRIECGNSVGKARPRHRVADVECQGPVVSIIVTLGMFLSLKQAFPDVSDERVTFLDKGVDRGCSSRCRIVRDQGWRRPTIDHVKRSSA